MLHGVEREEGGTDRGNESTISQRYVPHICINLGRYLTCGTDYAADGHEEKIFKIVLELSDNMPDKADLLYNCGVGFLGSFLGNTNKKEDIDNCILAYEWAVHFPRAIHWQTSPFD